MERYGLSQTGCVVLYGDILENDVIALDLERIGAESTQGMLVGEVEVLDVGVVIIGDDGVVAILAADLYIGKEGGDGELLLIDTFLNVDDLVILHKGATHVDGLVNVTEVSCTVTRDKDGIGIVPTLFFRGSLHASDGEQCQQ